MHSNLESTYPDMLISPWWCKGVSIVDLYSLLTTMHLQLSITIFSIIRKQIPLIWISFIILATYINDEDSSYAKLGVRQSNYMFTISHSCIYTWHSLAINYLPVKLLVIYVLVMMLNISYQIHMTINHMELSIKAANWNPCCQEDRDIEELPLIYHNQWI